MQVLHLHWQPPTTPAEAGNLVVWAEDASLPAPKKYRASKKPKAKPHPFAHISDALIEVVTATGVGHDVQREVEIVLLLPTGRYGPRPSPQLRHGWDLSDGDDPPSLVPWQINGLSLPPQAGVTLLANLPAAENLPPGLVLGTDWSYWQVATDLVLETLAAQKVLPTLAQADREGKTFHARWLPVLDGPTTARAWPSCARPCRRSVERKQQTRPKPPPPGSYSIPSSTP